MLFSAFKKWHFDYHVLKNQNILTFGSIKIKEWNVQKHQRLITKFSLREFVTNSGKDKKHRQLVLRNYRTVKSA